MILSFTLKLYKNRSNCTNDNDNSRKSDIVVSGNWQLEIKERKMGQ